ncbi:hypothetical protein NIES21_61190 (plasmid) [Anabaenopsis circularis NIES-21]|uniref:Uncharacterized protein n=1 Tax=Anabaenopsis circularis NIES-21 TaxID=1085406 RepID=A0A1Z4GRY1_9CYAN|nr:hypothetical protein NIES21_61190 [Anabaenopsis circularis NIES-21]
MKNKSLKNKVDSIRRTLKSQGLEVSSAAVESKILDNCPNFEEDWSSDIRSEILQLLITDLRPSELATINSVESENDLVASAVEEDEVNIHTIAVQEKSELVATTAQSMGLILNAEEIESIADSVDSTTDNFEFMLSEVKTALLEFVRYKAESNNQKIAQTMDEVVEYAETKFSENSQHLSERLQDLKSRISATDTRNKSQLTLILNRLKLPTCKTG